jgi:ATP-dependent DNA ligase
VSPAAVLDLPVRPPLAPMLGRLSRRMPRDGYLYEPKWDGFRCLAFRARVNVDLRSRHGRPLARYFPEIAEAIGALAEERFAIDGEIIIVTKHGFDFAALMGRLHPAETRVERLRRENPATFVAFDILALGDVDLTGRPFEQRRGILAELLADAVHPLHLTPATDDPEMARDWLVRFQGGGIDGVMAKRRQDPYRAGARSMVKVKPERTADCVVAGFRTYLGEPAVASLLLGLYDGDGGLQHIGVASSFPETRRRELFGELQALAVPVAEHPWKDGFLLGGGAMGRLPGAAGRWEPGLELDWTPLAPERVCEVAYDQIDDHRLRHPARFRRWRPDREARSCHLGQLSTDPVDPAELLQ